jgi:hypothetical protein
VFRLWQLCGVQDMLGINGGYRGYYIIHREPRKEGDRCKWGGTFLGTNRGGHDTTKIVNSVE